MTKKLSNEIMQAAEEMSQQEFYDYLSELEYQKIIEIYPDGWDHAIDFALHLVNSMKDSLEKGEWYGYETKALQALEKIPCNENDIIEIDNYGYPQEIKDNRELLCILGIDNQLARSTTPTYALRA